MNKGTILGFHGTWGSGIAHLEIQDSKTGIASMIPCENSCTVRNL